MASEQRDKIKFRKRIKPKNKSIVRVVTVQMNSLDDAEYAKKRGLWLSEKAIEIYKPDLLCLPECYYAYGRNNMIKWAEKIPGFLSCKFSAMAKRARCAIVYGQPEIVDDKLYNTAVIIGDDGSIVGKYHKLQLHHTWVDKLDHEPNYFQSGDCLGLFDLPFARIGVMICHDGAYPEIFRSLTLRGADLLVWLVRAKGHTGDGQKIFSRLNYIPIIAANIGSEVGGGNSAITNCKGEIISRLQGGEGFCFAEINIMERYEKHRFKGKCIGQYLGVSNLFRRPELYV